MNSTIKIPVTLLYENRNEGEKYIIIVRTSENRKIFYRGTHNIININYALYFYCTDYTVMRARTVYMNMIIKYNENGEKPKVIIIILLSFRVDIIIS